MACESINTRKSCPAVGPCWTVVIPTVAALLLALAAVEASPGASKQATASRGRQPPEEHPTQQMTIEGHVVGPDRMPVANAQVAVEVERVQRSQKPEGTYFGSGLARTLQLWGSCRTDNGGRFRLTGPRSSASVPYFYATLYAAAPGYGVIIKPVDPAAVRQTVDVELDPERAILGRLIDLQGQPAVGVQVRIVDRDVPVWPKPVVTDDKGRFYLRGLGRAYVTLEIRHPRFAPLSLPNIEPRPVQDTKERTFTLIGRRKLRARVTYADTSEPAADVRLMAVASKDEYGMGYLTVEGRTDEQGRVSLNVFPGDYVRIVVHPRDGTPYLTLRQVVPWALAAKQEVDLTLPRGIIVRGKVVESPSGKLVAGARVQFRPRENNNPFYRRDFQAGSLEENLETAISGADGSFHLAVLPGRGHLFVLGPTTDYLHVETSWGQLEYGRPGGLRYYPDALVALNLKRETANHDLALVKLRRGVTVKGRVLGPDGKPVEQFKVLCRSYMPLGFERWQRPDNVLEGRDGRFELPGCDPEKRFTAWFLDWKHDLGTTMELSPKAGRTPATVRLQRCGSAVARFVDTNGKPKADYYPFFSMVITPGASMAASIFTGHDDKKALEADWFNWGNLLSGPPYLEMRTNARGRVTFPVLIPGATYRLMLPHLPKGGQQEAADKGMPTKDFSVKPGETLDLGDITFRDR